MHFSSHWPLTFRSIGPARKVKIICNYNPISSSLLRRFCCHTIFNHQFTYRLTVLSRKWVLQETPFYNIRTPTRSCIEFTFINNVYFKLLTPIDLIRWNRKTGKEDQSFLKMNKECYELYHLNIKISHLLLALLLNIISIFISLFS